MSSSAHPSFQSPLSRASVLFEESVGPLIPDASVYIDSQFAAVLRSSLPDGLSVFLDAGAWNIKSIVKSSELSLQRNDDKLSVPDSDKLLILISSHISDYLDHIKHILSSDVYSKVSIVVSSPIRLPPSTLASINDPEVDIDSSFDQHSDPELLTSKITSWMMMGYKNMKRVLPSEDALEVHLDLLPLNWIFIVQDLVALKSLQVDSSAKFQQMQDTIPLQQSFHDLAKELFVMFEGMNLIPSIYAMGTSSSYVGKTMHNLRLKLQSPDAGKAEATLILMDRSLDLVTPNIHSDNLMDQIFKLLPRQVKSKKDGIKSNDAYTETLLDLYPELNEERRGSEVYISLDPLIDDSSRKILSASLSDPHMRVSLRHHQDPQIINLFDDMINLPQKDSLTSVRSRIIDLITSHASPVKLPRILGKVSLNQLTKLLTGFVSSDPDNSLEKGGKLLEVIQGVVECLNESQNQNYESFQSLEKILLLSLSSSECSDPIGTLKNQISFCRKTKTMRTEVTKRRTMP
ncbi:hypothetical protein BKA69DRAFT_641353 [Paraphysoderma sedebokerense]|nr:hypothetical protein BKA69DRAFT_641353 [Paraphysoderma sedebokerense]